VGIGRSQVGDEGAELVVDGEVVDQVQFVDGGGGAHQRT
jgi:hypothetical protein